MTPSYPNPFSSCSARSQGLFRYPLAPRLHPHTALFICSAGLPRLPHLPHPLLSMTANSSVSSPFSWDTPFCLLSSQVGVAILTCSPQGRRISLQSSWLPRPHLYSPSSCKTPCSFRLAPFILLSIPDASLGLLVNHLLTDHLGSWAPGVLSTPTPS